MVLGLTASARKKDGDELRMAVSITSALESEFIRFLMIDACP